VVLLQMEAQFECVFLMAQNLLLGRSLILALLLIQQIKFKSNLEILAIIPTLMETFACFVQMLMRLLNQWETELIPN